MKPRTLLAAAALTLASLPAAAGAEPTPQERMLAQTLFESGRARLAAGQRTEACAQFAESYRLDVAAGTLLNLALCHEADGRLAVAFAELSESLTRAIRDGRSDRQKTAKDHLAAISAKLPKLIVQVPQGLPADARVELDAMPLARAAWGTPIPIDPGEHELVVSASGRKTSVIKVSVSADGASHEISLAVPEPAAPPPAAKPPAPPPKPVAAATPKAPARSTTGRTIGYALLGLGGVGLAGGAAMGLLARDAWSEATASCPGGRCADPGRVSDGARAGTLADVATVAIVGGVAIAATGLVLVLRSPGAKSTAYVTPGPLGAAFGGKF